MVFTLLRACTSTEEEVETLKPFTTGQKSSSLRACLSCPDLRALLKRYLAFEYPNHHPQTTMSMFSDLAKDSIPVSASGYLTVCLHNTEMVTNVSFCCRSWQIPYMLWNGFALPLPALPFLRSRTAKSRMVKQQHNSSSCPLFKAYLPFTTSVHLSPSSFHVRCLLGR